jgi:hypothetical protein
MGESVHSRISARKLVTERAGRLRKRRKRSTLEKSPLVEGAVMRSRSRLQRQTQQHHPRRKKGAGIEQRIRRRTRTCGGKLGLGRMRC